MSMTSETGEAYLSHAHPLAYMNADLLGGANTQ
jgi:hypothetical protein